MKDDEEIHLGTDKGEWLLKRVEIGSEEVREFRTCPLTDLPALGRAFIEIGHPEGLEIEAVSDQQWLDLGTELMRHHMGKATMFTEDEDAD